MGRVRSSGSTDPVEEYLRTRDRYFRNAEAMLGSGEPRKASEMLWGAVAQGVKALAANRSLSIRTNDELTKFISAKLLVEFSVQKYAVDVVTKQYKDSIYMI